MRAERAPASVAQLGGSPARRFYTGADLRRAVTIGDLRARTHKRLPRFALEYLEGGAEEEETLAREREAFAEWRFTPRTLVDVSSRSLETSIFGKAAPAPLIVAPTGLNGVFRRGADIALAQGAAAAQAPFVQSTMSNELLEDVARVPGLRHWWQLYVFGGDEIWQDLVRRADEAGCEALVLTTNSQIFGNREWDARTRATRSRPSLPTILDAAWHAPWLVSALGRGMPVFKNVIDFVPRDRRGFFESAFWIRDQMPQSLSWRTLAQIRARWRKPFILKGVLNLGDVQRAVDCGVDAIALGSHGGRQLDSAISALDILPQARALAGDRAALFMSGGVRRGTDLLKALALGADAVMVGRAPLYGVCAAGAAGVQHALAILEREAHDALGLAGARRPHEIGDGLLVHLDAAGRGTGLNRALLDAY
jgi:(S)-mandelate dehydrogenase